MRLTDADKEHIAKLRARGDSYQKIANKLGFPKSTITSYIMRHGIQKSTLTDNEKTLFVNCLHCGAELHQLPKRKRKKFCNAACRIAWWAAHQDKVNRKTVPRTCVFCGKEFAANECTTKKYCSTECYFKARFKDYTPKAQRNDSRAISGGEEHTALPDGCLCASCAWFHDGKRHCSGCKAATEAL